MQEQQAKSSETKPTVSTQDKSGAREKIKMANNDHNIVVAALLISTGSSLEEESDAEYFQLLHSLLYFSLMYDSFISTSFQCYKTFCP